MHFAMPGFTWVLDVLIMVLILAWQRLYPLDPLPIPYVYTSSLDSSVDPVPRVPFVLPTSTFVLQPGSWALTLNLNSGGT